MKKRLEFGTGKAKSVQKSPESWQASSQPFEHLPETGIIQVPDGPERSQAKRQAHRIWAETHVRMKSLHQKLHSKKMERPQLLEFKAHSANPEDFKSQRGKKKSTSPAVLKWSRTHQVTIVRAEEVVSPLLKGRFLKNSAFLGLPRRQEHTSDWTLLLPGFHGDKCSGFYPHSFNGGVLFLCDSLSVQLAVCADEATQAVLMNLICSW